MNSPRISPPDAPPIRVLFVNQYYWPDLSASAQHVADLAEYLVEQGFAVDVLCSRGTYEASAPPRPLTESWRGVGIRRVRAWGNRSAGLLSRMLAHTGFHVQCFGWLLRHGGRYDVVVTLTDPPLVGLHAAAARRGPFTPVKHVFWCMDLNVDCLVGLGWLRPHGPLGLVLAALNRLELRRADRVVALGPCMRERIADKGVAPQRIEVIGPWSRGDELTPTAPDANPLRAQHGLADKIVVMYSGNAGRTHAFGAIRQAMTALRDDPRVRFLFVGGGKRIEEIDAHVERERLQNVLRLPYVPREQLNESLGMGDLHLVTLRPLMDGVVVPSKLYGALAVARPVLYCGPAASTIARDIRAADAGVVLEHDDGPGLIAAIQRLAADAAERDRLGRNGRAFFERTHERTVCCKAWEQLLRNVVAQPEPLTAPI